MLLRLDLFSPLQCCSLFGFSAGISAAILEKKAESIVNDPENCHQTFNKWHCGSCECSIGRLICKICECLLPTTLRNYRVAALVNTAFGLMINGAFALNGRMAVLTTW